MGIVKERQYITSRQSDWDAWDRWLEATDRRRRAGAEVIPPAVLAQRFRRLCLDAALVRDRNYSAALGEDVHHRVLAVHQRIYGAGRPESGAIRRFVGADFPILVRREGRLVVAAVLLFFLPLLAMMAAIQVWPDASLLILSPETVSEIEEMYSPTARHVGRPRAASSDWAMWGFYIANNVRIDFQAFAGGVAFGLGTVFFLLYNALVIGAVAGHLTQIGYGVTFWGFVAGHSAFELTGAVLSGAGGLKLGMALVAPGNRTRLAALQEESRVAVRLLVGAAVLTLLAAFVEAFWSPSPVAPWWLKVAVGLGLWLLTWGYLLFAGRRFGAT